MKKILGISLCALFAVSAANAEIASKLYVDQEVGANTSSINTLTGRVDGHDTAIEGLQAVTTGLGTAAYKSTEYFATSAQGAKADSAVQAADVTTGTDNGTINVKGNPVTVKGLGSAAFTDTSAYAPYTLTETVNTNTTNIQTNAEAIDALQGSVGGLGELAHESTVTTNFITDQAVTSAKIADGTIMNADIADGTITTGKIAFSGPQTNALNSGINSGLVTQIGTNETDIATNADGIAANKTAIEGLQAVTTGLGTAAYKSTEYFATSAQGAKADSAVQAADVTTGTDNGTINVKGNPVTVKGLGSAAFTDTSAYAPYTLTETVNTNTDSIGDIQDFLDTMINEAPGYTDCKDSSYGCTLVVRNGRFSWEAVARATGETAQ